MARFVTSLAAWSSVTAPAADTARSRTPIDPLPLTVLLVIRCSTDTLPTASDTSLLRAIAPAAVEPISSTPAVNRSSSASVSPNLPEASVPRSIWPFVVGLSVTRLEPAVIVVLIAMSSAVSTIAPSLVESVLIDSAMVSTLPAFSDTSTVPPPVVTIPPRPADALPTVRPPVLTRYSPAEPTLASRLSTSVSRALPTPAPAKAIKASVGAWMSWSLTSPPSRMLPKLLFTSTAGAVLQVVTSRPIVMLPSASSLMGPLPALINATSGPLSLIVITPTDEPAGLSAVSVMLPLVLVISPPVPRRMSFAASIRIAPETEVTAPLSRMSAADVATALL